MKSGDVEEGWSKHVETYLQSWEGDMKKVFIVIFLFFPIICFAQSADHVSEQELMKTMRQITMRTSHHFNEGLEKEFQNQFGNIDAMTTEEREQKAIEVVNEITRPGHKDLRSLWKLSFFAISLAPESPHVAEAYAASGGISLVWLGDREQGIHSLNKAIELDPDLAVAYYTLGSFFDREAWATHDDQLQKKADQYLDKAVVLFRAQGEENMAQSIEDSRLQKTEHHEKQE